MCSDAGEGRRETEAEYHKDPGPLFRKSGRERGEIGGRGGREREREDSERHRGGERARERGGEREEQRER